MKFVISTFIVALLLVTVETVIAQAPFAGEIQAFKQQDSVSFPPKNAILLVGSSSFRKWTDVASYFPGYTIINRGFGGSVLPDVIHYANEIILPYHPKQVIIYCGDNDLASSDTISSTIVFNRFKQLYSIIRNGLPKSNISYVSIKPSPSREHLMYKMEEANNYIKAFLKKQKRAHFIDVYHPMLLATGKPDPALFLSDNLHMNEKGYAIWQRAMLPYLKK